ncbi:MAG: disulfide bond formation protein B, partial [Proteobacteria bacterium]|nr:disulfide bond formation protein B [Pseudomonadota bacterium]
MMIDPARMDWSRLVPFAILAVSIGALATAYTAELTFDVEPCILCLYQRIPYALAGALALAALLAPGTWGPRPKVWAV